MQVALSCLTKTSICCLDLRYLFSHCCLLTTMFVEPLITLMDLQQTFCQRSFCREASWQKALEVNSPSGRKPSLRGKAFLYKRLKTRWVMSTLWTQHYVNTDMNNVSFSLQTETAQSGPMVTLCQEQAGFWKVSILHQMIPTTLFWCLILNQMVSNSLELGCSSEYLQIKLSCLRFAVRVKHFWWVHKARSTWHL